MFVALVFDYLIPFRSSHSVMKYELFGVLNDFNSLHVFQHLQGKTYSDLLASSNLLNSTDWLQLLKHENFC